MAKKATATATVHPFATSRIEKASNELSAIRAQIKQLEDRKAELSGRILTMLHNDGEKDEEGKIRYETDRHKFVIIQGVNTYTDKKHMVTALSASGLTPKQIASVVKACVTETPYEYAGVYVKKEAADEKERAS